LKIVLLSFLFVYSITGFATSKNWSNFVRSLSVLEHRVKSGDTLSKITQQYLGDRDYWPKLWEVNQKTVSNPHLLEPEQVILFDSVPSAEKRDLTSSFPEIQAKLKETVDEIPDQLFRPAFKNQHRLRFIVLSPQEILGVVTGAYENRNFLTVNDLVYIGAFDKSKVVPGQRYALVREMSEKEKANSKAQSLPSSLKRVVGEVQIERYGADLALARISAAQDLIERGDKLAQVPILTLQDPESAPSANLSSRILLGESLEDTLIFIGQLILLEGGNQKGIQLGNVFSVFDDEDPVFKASILIEPRSKAEIKVVWVGEEVSVGYVMKAKDLVKVGDALIPSLSPQSNTKAQLYRQRTNIE